MAQRAADTAIQIADDDSTVIPENAFHRLQPIKANGGLVKVEREFDCATLVAASYKLNGLNVPIELYTGDLVRNFRQLGMFTVLRAHRTQTAALTRKWGALYVDRKLALAAACVHDDRRRSDGSKRRRALQNHR
jgi:hypothetical protein